VARVQPPGEIPGRAFGIADGHCIRSAGRSVSGRSAADPARRRRWRRRLLGVCLVAAIVGWRATLASAAISTGFPAPTGLSATAAGSSQISLAWTAPAAPLGWQVFQYNIYAGTISGEESLAGSSSATNGTSYTATGLTSGTTYYFEVTAVYQLVNQSCAVPCQDIEGARSTETSATTGFSVPGAPTGLTATDAGSSRVRLSWTAPTAPADAPVTGYKIYAGTSPGGESLAGNSSATGDTVSGLSSGTTYYFEVTALNSAGESALSNEASATTDRAVQGLKSQLIRFGPLAPHAAGVSFTVSASASSGLLVSFGSDTPGVCSVSGSVVTTVKPGTCTITATQDGNADFAPAPDQTQSFQVDRIQGRLRPQTITFLHPADVTAGRPDRLSASASSGLPVSFGSDTPGVCSVSGSVVTAVKPGTCTITASQAGNTQYAPATDQTQSFQISPGVPGAPWIPIIVLAGIVLAAAAGALLARRHRMRARPPAKLRVRAEPHADSRGPVRLRVTGTDITTTVRIEPHPAPVSARLERPSHERHWTRADT
jgi:Fibronectin type III domain